MEHGSDGQFAHFGEAAEPNGFDHSFRMACPGGQINRNGFVDMCQTGYQGLLCVFSLEQGVILLAVWAKFKGGAPKCLGHRYGLYKQP